MTSSNHGPGSRVGMTTRTAGGAGVSAEVESEADCTAPLRYRFVDHLDRHPDQAINLCAP